MSNSGQSGWNLVKTAVGKFPFQGSHAAWHYVGGPNENAGF